MRYVDAKMMCEIDNEVSKRSAAEKVTAARSMARLTNEVILGIDPKKLTEEDETRVNVMCDHIHRAHEIASEILLGLPSDTSWEEAQNVSFMEVLDVIKDVAAGFAEGFKCEAKGSD